MLKGETSNSAIPPSHEQQCKNCQSNKFGIRRMQTNKKTTPIAIPKWKTHKTNESDYTIKDRFLME